MIVHYTSPVVEWPAQLTPGTQVSPRQSSAGGVAGGGVAGEDAGGDAGGGGRDDHLF